MATALEVYRRRCIAQERKKIHESSEYIYPMREKNNGKPAPRKTSYSVDFAKKEGKPAMPRPCSVTRRNRPHPSQVNTLTIFRMSSGKWQSTFTLEIGVCVLILSVILLFCTSPWPELQIGNAFSRSCR